MADREKLLYHTWLFLAVAGGLCSSLWGCTGILGALWMKYTLLQTSPFALLLFQIPLFLCAMMFSRRFILGLWGIAIVYPTAILLLDREMFTSTFSFIFDFGVGTIGPLLTAAFSQFHAHPNPFSRDPKPSGVEDAPNG